MTQAINLANFSNSLDSAGQIPPTALNAAVPISKGGTGAATAAAAATALAAAFGNLLFPVGSTYTNVSNATNPATLLGFGTWTALAAGKLQIGQGVTDTVTAGSFVIGYKYTIVSVGTTNFTLIGASANTVGIVFTATGVGAGTGTASKTWVAGDTGGSTDSVVPYHNHANTLTDPTHRHSYTTPSGGNYEPTGLYNSGSPGVYSGNTGFASTGITITNAYAGTAGNTLNANLQPFIVVYMWQRTA